MFTRKSTRLLGAALFGLLLWATACDSHSSEDDNDNGTTLQGTTRIISSTLNSAQKIGGPKGRQLQNDYAITPNNVTGEALSVLFASRDQVDEGIVVFGDGRPDIAPETAQKYPFDMANQLAISSSVSLKPGFIGGPSEHIVSLFGYIDLEITLDNGMDKTLRVALTTFDGMVRGDKLLQIGTTFQWYDLDTNQFTATRPTNPATITAIAMFTDPIRPNLVYYPLNVFLRNPPSVTLDAAQLQTASAVDVTIDFVMQDAIRLVGQTTSSLSDDILVMSFDLSQSFYGFGSSGLAADATFQIIP